MPARKPKVPLKKKIIRALHPFKTLKAMHRKMQYATTRRFTKKQGSSRENFFEPRLDSHMEELNEELKRIIKKRGG